MRKIITALEKGKGPTWLLRIVNGWPETINGKKPFNQVIPEIYNFRIEISELPEKLKDIFKILFYRETSVVLYDFIKAVDHRELLTLKEMINYLKTLEQK